VGGKMSKASQIIILCEEIFGPVDNILKKHYLPGPYIIIAINNNGRKNILKKAKRH